MVSAKQPITGAVVPAARPLAQFASYRTHRTDLLTRYPLGRLRDRRILPPHLDIVQQFLNRSRSADSQSGFRTLDASKLRNILYINQALWVNDVILHQREQVRAARQDFGFGEARAEQGHCLLLCRRAGVLKLSHWGLPSFRAPEALDPASAPHAALPRPYHF